MALVWEATKAAEDSATDHAAHQRFFASLQGIHGV
jgi:hypothetical protein